MCRACEWRVSEYNVQIGLSTTLVGAVELTFVTVKSWRLVESEIHLLQWHKSPNYGSEPPSSKARCACSSPLEQPRQTRAIHARIGAVARALGKPESPGAKFWRWLVWVWHGGGHARSLCDVGTAGKLHSKGSYGAVSGAGPGAAP